MWAQVLGLEQDLDQSVVQRLAQVSVRQSVEDWALVLVWE
jgi:hypothetical protein